VVPEIRYAAPPTPPPPPPPLPPPTPRDADQERAAATQIQSIQRGKAARAEVDGLRSQAAEQAEKQSAAATQIQSMQRGKAARAEADGLRSQQPPAPPPENTAPTEADLEMVAKEADAQLQQLDLGLVKLHVLERRIELLKSIDFHGSRRKAVGLQGASLEDPVAVQQVCNETAVAIHVCNKVLETHGFKTFGLVVAGHTSGKWFKQQDVDVAGTPGYEISVNRAKTVLANLVCEIRKVSPTYQLQDEVRVEFRGYGCTQPMKGFDDGGNHAENRRVEINLLFNEDKSE